MKRALATGICLLIVAIPVIFIMLGERGHSFRQIQAEYQSALLDGNGELVWKLADHKEFEINSMDEKAVDHFFHDWVALHVSKRLDSQTGTREGGLGVPISVEKTPDGLKVVRPISSIVLAIAAVKPGVGASLGGLDRLNTYAMNAPKLAKELAPFGVKYVIVAPGQEPMTIVRFGRWSAERYQSHFSKH